MSTIDHERKYCLALHQLWEWQYDNLNSFTSQLYSLFHKADHWNQGRLAKAFPLEFAAYHAWLVAPDPYKFFAGIFPGKFGELNESSAVETASVPDSGIPREFEYPENETNGG